MTWLISRALMEDYANSRSLPERAAESLAGACSDGALSAQSNANPIPQAYCAPGRMTAFSRLSRFGMTFAPLTESHGAELLTWYRAGFPARTSAQPEREPASPERAADCGKKWHESSAKYDPVSCSWKTVQCSLLADSEPSLETWPRWGSMRNGACYRQPMLARRISGSDAGLWLTPTATAISGRSESAMEYRKEYRNSIGRQTCPPGNLAEQVTMSGEIPCVNMLKPTMWPTPTQDSATERNKRYAQGGIPLTLAIKMWPIPCATDHKGSGQTGTLRDRLDYAVERGATKSNVYATPQARDFRSGQTSRWDDQDRSRNLNDQIGGKLNPTWVEWLMNWPLGWTDLKPLATDKCHCAPQPHSGCCGKG